jgi:hypothetical protein
MRFLQFINRMLSHRFAPLVAFILLAVVFAGIFQHQVNQIDRTQAKQAATQKEQATTIHFACSRFNIELANENASHYLDYDFFSQIYKENKDAAPFDKALLQKIQIAVPQNYNRDIKIALARLQRDFKYKTWTPLLDCNSVTTPKFIVPRPIRFTQQIPPARDLRLPSVEASSKPGY